MGSLCDLMVPCQFVRLVAVQVSGLKGGGGGGNALWSWRLLFAGGGDNTYLIFRCVCSIRDRLGFYAEIQIIFGTWYCMNKVASAVGIIIQNMP